MKKYIEQEAAIELGKKQSCAGIIDGGDFCNISANMLRKIPAADVVEVRHGEWINDKGLYRCSNCKHLWSELWWTEIVPFEKMVKIMPYCPNCGAKMDGGINNAVDRR